MPDSVELAFLAIVFGAYLVGTVLGFGTTIITVTFGAQMFPMDVVLPIVAPLNIALGGYIAVRYHAATQWRMLFRRVLLPCVLGLPFGLLLFNLREVEWLRLGFGVFVTVLAVMQLRVTYADKTTGAPKPLSRPVGGGLLWLAGLVHGLWATPGPLIVYVMGRELDDKHKFRSTISTLFIPLTTALLVDYYLLGLFTPKVIRLGLMSIIPVAAGMVLGEVAIRRLNQRAFQVGVWYLLLAGGVVLTARAALAG